MDTRELPVVGMFQHVSTTTIQHLYSKKHLVANIPLVERLQWLFSNADPALLVFGNEQHEHNVYEFHNRFMVNHTITNVRKAIQEAFLALDSDISDAAMPNIKGQVCKMSVKVANIRFMCSGLTNTP